MVGDFTASKKHQENCYYLSSLGLKGQRRAMVKEPQREPWREQLGGMVPGTEGT